ncbi:hypothetical protein ACJ5NV_01515 [Loktanella agnita]|uniref:hypothetical protein n=1 Tax=Loktanella agnita TaxID=287097 RepID=UPI0039885A98
MKTAALLNNADDQMDAVLGIVGPKSRIPVEQIARAIMRSPTLNNFVINNSQVGVLNTGSIDRIDAAITLSKGSDVEPIMDHIKSVVAAVIASENIENAEKNEIIDLADAAAEELVGRRRLPSIIAQVKAIREKIGGVLVLSDAVDKLLEAVRNGLT